MPSYIDNHSFYAKARKNFGVARGEWFYNHFEDYYQCQPYSLTQEEPVSLLLAKTKRIVEAMECPQIVVFPDCGSGWKNVPDIRRYAPVSMWSSDELVRWLRQHMYFRDSTREYEDNYNICCANFSWVIVFCHHGDWHFFSTKEKTLRVRFLLDRWNEREGEQQGNVP